MNAKHHNTHTCTVQSVNKHTHKHTVVAVRFVYKGRGSESTKGIGWRVEVVVCYVTLLFQYLSEGNIVLFLLIYTYVTVIGRTVSFI